MDVNDQSLAVCPEPEQLAAYVDGRVTVAERATIQRHLADCEDCREVVADVVRLADEPGNVLPFWQRRKVQAIGGGVLALAASLILVVQVRPELNPFRRPTPYEELVMAVGTNRMIEGRLTGGFRHGDLHVPTRSADARQRQDYALLAAVARIQKAAAESQTTDNRHALAVAYLIVGEADRSIALLEDLVAPSSESAQLFSDLSAAYLARAASSARPDDYGSALKAADRALALSPSVEARFNRALALQGTNNVDAALRAWREYLAHDSESAWAHEARRRVTELSKTVRLPQD